VIALVAALLALSATPALAARGHVYDPAAPKIGTPCTVTPCGGGELTEPSGLAVDETTHDIFVVDAGNDRVQAFGPAGAFIFMLGGKVDKTAVESGTATEAEENICTAASGDECQPGTVGIGAGQFEEISAIAVDNSGDPTDPSRGGLYVVDKASRRVEKFGPSGVFLNQIDLSGLEPVLGIAVDPEGLVSVLQEIQTVSSYTDALVNQPTGSPKEPGALEFGNGFARNPDSLAVDGGGDFYIARNGGGKPNRFGKVGPPIREGKIFTTYINELDEGPSSALAVEAGTDVAYLDDVTSVAVFSPAGIELERFGFSNELTEGTGVAVDAGSGFAYVADAANGHLLVLAPIPPGPPTVEPGTQSVSAVTSASATLEAELNPRSEENEEPTTYVFQYGPCADLDLCASLASTPPATLPPDFAAHPISARIAGLLPGTTYHFRVVASNHQGTLSGEEFAFTTQSTGPFALPDLRQWQLVSPARKLGAAIEPLGEAGVIQAAADGSAITYLTKTPTEAEPQGFTGFNWVLSRRGPGSWDTRDISIPHAGATGTNISGVEYQFFDSGLTQSVVQPFGEFIPGLSPEASESTAYLHDLSGSCGASCYRPLVTGRPGFANVPEGVHFGEEAPCKPQSAGNASPVCGPSFVGATEDLAHVILRAGPLTTDPTDHGGLYEWSGGVLAKVNVLPSGEPAPTGGELGLKNQATRRAISADGARVVFETVQGGIPDLYLRADATAPQSASGACDEAGRACTLQLDAAEPACLAALACESGGGEFQIANTDDSRVFFTDTHKLTTGSGASTSSPPRSDLYECRIVEPTPGHLECDLTDLTPEAGGRSAEVQGGVLGASADGSYLYFVARGVLSEVPNARGQSAISGQPNLYLSHDGSMNFIATLSGGDEHDWRQLLPKQPTRVSDDGQWLELMSEASLTGYDNRDLATGRPVAEVYLYDAASGRLLCASCEPSGARPTGVEYEKLVSANGALVGQIDIWPGSSLVAANVPGWTAAGGAGGEPGAKSRYQDRYLSDSGRLFFNTADPLVPQDSNGTQDVYEYEPPLGPGQPASNTCTAASPTYVPSASGCVSLISAGTSGRESAFLDASESGDDVFFLTQSRLVPADEDAALDIYDSHSCSASSPCLPEPAPPAPACAGDACQLPATPPVDPTPGSLTFQGAGNVVACPKGKVVKKGKCVKKAKPKKKNGHKKHKKNGKAGKSKGGGKNKSSAKKKGGGK
jgi:DNA-binding beta-propeller fold protein YncE